MSNHIVAIAIDRVQTFLYYSLYAQVQESQMNDNTLSKIIYASRLISEQFYESVGLTGNTGQFFGHVKEKILVCSGKCIFSTDLAEDEILIKLDELFSNYYLQFQGQMLVKYVVFEQPIENSADKLTAIQKSLTELRGAACLSKLVERQQQLLFNFQEKLNPQIPELSEKDYKSFSRNINELFSEKEADNGNHFRIAVIKADLDGMGELFKSIGDYATYSQVSDLLTRYIQLNQLHEEAEEIKRAHSDFKIYPLYVAGDDIFFAVPAAHLIDGIDICKRILMKLNHGLKAISIQSGTPPEYLKLSIGVDFTFNREPIRYYYDRVERQIVEAKLASPLNASNWEKAIPYTKISISNYVLYDYDKQKVKDEKRGELNADKPNWRHFISAVGRLKAAMQEGFASNRFFYSLLDKISDPEICKSDIRYSNAVFYHLLPQHLESSNQKLRESELLLLESLVNQLLVKQRRSSSVIVEDGQRHRLEKYVRLLLLFSDPRFKVNANMPRETNPADALDNSARKRIRSSLFNKTLRYLFDDSLGAHGGRELRDVFVENTRYRTSADDKRGKQIYRTLRVGSSMFHRIKQLKGDNAVGIAAKMIASMNSRTEEELKELEGERGPYQAPLGLPFDPVTFIRLAKSSKAWNEDYIDALLIFYKLKELSIVYKKRYPSNTPTQKKSDNKGRRS